MTPPRPQRRTGADGELSDDRYVAGNDLTHWRSPLGRWLASLMQAVSQRLGAQAALVAILAIGGGIAAIVTAGFAWVYDSVAEHDGLAGLDHPVLAEAMQLRSPLVNELVTGYTDIGGGTIMPILAASIAVFLAVWRRAATPLILMVAAGGGSLLMTVAGKQLFGRSRPPLSDAVPPYEHSPSFPSGTPSTPPSSPASSPTCSSCGSTEHCSAPSPSPWPVCSPSPSDCPGCSSVTTG